MMQTGLIMMPDGPHLYTRTWLPSNTPEANVVLIHGYGDHSGRYEHLVHILNEGSLGVYSYDQRGFGRSDGHRGYITRFDTLLAD
ncbi:MAG: alpha/beta hydrolase, partial [Candidatus Hydrogenedentes bacterium]|nr:alpha/beta hydrolase [Candidatus Hydrogenedentota bacterium]